MRKPLSNPIRRTGLIKMWLVSAGALILLLTSAAVPSTFSVGAKAFFLLRSVNSEEEFNAVLSRAPPAAPVSDEVKRRIHSEGGDPLTSMPDEYAADIDKEEAKWSALIRTLNLKVE